MSFTFVTSWANFSGRTCSKGSLECWHFSKKAISDASKPFKKQTSSWPKSFISKIIICSQDRKRINKLYCYITRPIKITKVSISTSKRTTQKQWVWINQRNVSESATLWMIMHWISLDMNKSCIKSLGRSGPQLKNSRETNRVFKILEYQAAYR